ncbi:MAG: C25 family cysteine peptidase [Candidatus Cyclobacteriaceae bacterium M2_1C_046]
MSSRFFYIIFFVILSYSVQAQNYGFEWINYSQSYYKIPIGKDGFYKITYNDLVNAGLPVGSIDPRGIQIFHRGAEQAIRVVGQQDAKLDTEDHIIFYGTRNDGTLDKQLYQPSDAQPHNYYNLFSDTTSYFLTWKYSGADGKRINTFKEVNTSGLQKEAAHYSQILKVNTDQYSQGRTFYNYTRYSQFDYGEGFTGVRIQENKSIQYTLSGIRNIISTAGEPRLNVLLAGRSADMHRAEISVGKDAASLRTLGTIDFTGFTTVVYQDTIVYSDISASGEMVVQLKALGVDGGQDLLSTSYIELLYPQAFDQQDSTKGVYELKENINGKSYIEIANIPSGTVIYDITNNNEVFEIGYTLKANTAQAIVPNTGTERKLMAVSIYGTPVLKKVDFKKYDLSNAQYVIISHPELMKPADGYENAVAAYASYRASADGGGYDTLVVDVLQLYDQFSFGEITPLAVFNFVKWLKETASPEYLFFIGEGMEVHYNYHRRPGSYDFKDLIPPAGLPASDVLYSAGLGEQTYQPSIPTGRLTASTPEQVINYLDKVIAMENLPYDKLWRKRILHLSGGIKESEITAFKRYMDGFAEYARPPYLGGNVKTIQKDTKSTVEQINISDEVNNGLNLVTFFGHSSPGITDIDIGFVTNDINGYNNPDKYPVFLINGCEAGRFFVNGLLFGEDWMLAKNKGAIGFLAHTSFGFSYDLRKYTNIFYKTGFGDSVFVEKPLGNIHQETIKRYYNDFINPGPNQVAQAQQLLLLGDPATNLFGARRPDYSVSEGEVFVSSFDGGPVTALSDSFAVNVVVKNFGKALPDSFNVQLQRQVDNRLYTIDTIFKSTLYTDTLQLVIKRESLEDFGKNIFTITIDHGDAIAEYKETNNVVRFEYLLKLSATRNLLPYSFGVVNDTLDRIVIQSMDLLAKEKEFVIELDTTETFNSPALQSVNLNKRLLAEWEPDYINKDTVTYFLRSKFANAEPNEINDWDISSFIRIQNGSSGWGQNKIAQLKSNDVTGLTFDPITGEFKFEETTIGVGIWSFGSEHPDDSTLVSVDIDGTEYHVDNPYRCRDNTINIIAFDKETATPYAALPLPVNDPGRRICGRQPQIINNFRPSELSAGNVNDMLAAIDNIDHGDSIVLFSIGNAGFSTWPNEVKVKMEEIGIASDQWSNFLDGEPVIIAAKKGAAPGKAMIFQAEGDSLLKKDLMANLTVTGISSEGMMISPLIGPADQWHQFKLKIDSSASDAYSFNIDGFDSDGNRGSVVQNVTAENFDLTTLDATAFPYIRLSVNLSDKVDLTAPQINSWYVSYLPSAEGIVLPSAFDEKFVKEEGDTLKLTAGFYNLSPWDFNDSLAVNVRMPLASGSINGFNIEKIKGPTSRDTLNFELIFPTNGKVGSNDLYLSVSSNQEPEQYYENNILSVDDFLEVKKDNAAPVLDVRFDGIHIFNRDIVSPDPLITLVLKDENQYLQRKDTVGLNLYLKAACEGCTTYKRISFLSPEVNYYPVENKNEFIIEYRPGPLENGIYGLKMSASDVSGNTAGDPDQPYEVEFEVINESTITNFYPYPNPFSSNVRFIFTLTGNEIPDQLFVQIMTISGRVIREINLSEFGLLRIGNNISDYAWDGRDEFGDQLANGVYLYKVIVRKDGENLELRPSAGDEMFDKGYGKLYLLR